MADSAICSVEGCGKPRYSLGLCSSHYHRQHKRPHIPLSAPSATSRERIDKWLSAALATPTDDCIIWPFTRSKAGRACRSPSHGGTKYVHAQLCEQYHGPKPSPAHVAAHSCGRGHDGCINPRHVRWATTRENAADTIIHGTRRIGTMVNGARFTDADIIDIRARWARGETQTSIALLYGCRQNRISSIVNRGTWKHLP